MFVAIITTAILLFYLVYALTAEDMVLRYPGARALIAVYVLAFVGLGWAILLGGSRTANQWLLTVLVCSFPVWLLVVSVLKRERPHAEVWFIVVLSVTMLWETWR